MAATAYPHLSLEGSRLERGVSYKGCQVNINMLRESLKFSIRDFLSHFARFRRAQDICVKSEGGARPVELPAEQLEWIRRGGQFRELLV